MCDFQPHGTVDMDAGACLRITEVDFTKGDVGRGNVAAGCYGVHQGSEDSVQSIC